MTDSRSRVPLHVVHEGSYPQSAISSKQSAKTQSKAFWVIPESLLRGDCPIGRRVAVATECVDVIASGLLNSFAFSTRLVILRQRVWVFQPEN